MPTPTMLGDALELAELLRPLWPEFETGPLVCEGDEDDETKKAEEEAAAKAAAEKAEADAAAAKKAEEEAKLGDAGKAAIAAERKARRDAEKALKEAKEKLDAIEAESLSETEKAKKEAEEANSKVAAATDKLRRANLLSALGDKGLTGSRGKAAARLLDDVEYGDDDEPTNLDDALKAAKDEYGEEAFKGAKPKPRTTNSGDDDDDDGDKPKLSAEELAMAKSFGMKPEEYAKYKDPQAAAST